MLECEKEWRGRGRGEEGGGRSEREQNLFLEFFPTVAGRETLSLFAALKKSKGLRGNKSPKR